MGKVVDITDKLTFDGNPCLMINGEKLEVNADAPTMMKVINVTRNGGTSEENMNELYELVFPEKSRKVIDSLKLLVPDWMTAIHPVLCHPTLVYPAPACRRFEPPGNRSHELRNRLLFQQLSGGTAFAGYQTCQ